MAITKDDLIKHFQNVLTTIEDNQTLWSATEKAKEMTYVMDENWSSKSDKKYSEKAKIEVIESTTFNAASAYAKEHNVSVLNFANPVTVGGGVLNGAMAQEECLCRSSNLYSCLNQDKTKKDYYEYNKALGTTFYSDKVIVSLGVTVFMSDDVIPQELPSENWFNVNVLTCAAPYIAKRKHTNSKALKQLFKRRIKNIFECALSYQTEVIVLGAFGCGAFKNPPSIVAEAFYEVINENEYDYKFKKIIFAIKRSDTPCPNLIAFETQFQGLSAEQNLLRFCDNYALAQAIGEIRMPSGRVLKGGNEFNPYESWQYENKYYRKQFSILGDSISTLVGYNPRGYNVFFNEENSQKTNIKDMNDTWWGKLIKFYGGELLVNNSWSGSRVTKQPQSNSLFPSGCSAERTNGLHIDDVKPDVIIVYLGFNDWANGVTVQSESGHLQPLDEYFDFAYILMIQNLKKNYPDAEIWCCTLNTTFMSDNPSFKFPYAYGNNHIEDYNNLIVSVARENGCKVLDLYRYKLPNDTIDGSHPNENGMSTLATLMIRETADENGISFITCKENEHEMIETEVYTGGASHVCKKCGHRNEMTTITFDEAMESKRIVIKEHFEVSATEDSLIIREGTKNEFRVPYKSINKIQVTTTELGPIFDDMFAEIFTEFFSYVVMSENPLYKTIIFDILGENLELDYLKLTEAATCVFNNTFTIYPITEEVKNEIKQPINDDDYVIRLPDMTTELYSDVLKLTVCSSGQTFEFQTEPVSVGRDIECDLRVKDKDNGISRKHLSFTYEKGGWYVCDNDSTNGTWIGGTKLKSGKKYLLYSGDIIDLAHSERIIFNKHELSQKDKEITDANILTVLESSIISFSESNRKDDASFKMIVNSLIHAPLYVPMAVDTQAMFEGTQVDKLKAGDKLKLKNDVKMKVLTLNAGEQEIVPLFTSKEQMEKGQIVSIVQNYPDTYLPMLLKMEKHAIINPFDEHKFVISKEMIRDLLIPLLMEKAAYELKEQPAYVPKNDLCGTIINDKYKFERVISMTGVSTVYVGRRLSDSVTVAIKHIDKTKDSYKVVANALSSETEMMRKLRHPSIPQIYDSYENNESLSVVMEFLEGNTLDKVLQIHGGAIPHHKVIEYAIKIAEILQYLHSMQPPIIYRDMKPSNVLLANDGRIKMFDFGIARYYNKDKKEDTTLLGTRGYSAPEQFGGRQSDARTDIFGLGMTMYHLVTGDDPREITFEKKCIQDFNSELPKGLEYIINKCTELNPDNRYQTCQELIEDLKRYEELPPKKSFLKKLFG